MTETLLQTKLHIPIARSRIVPRSQLWARLNAGLEGRLSLVSAPAGFGKTTLISHWSRQLAESGDWSVAWFSIDENDNDPGRFFEYWIAALQKIDGRLGQSALELLRSPQGQDLRIILSDLINTLTRSAHAIVAVLDDFHHISNPAIHEGLAFLLDNAPPRFHLLLISRADPPIPFARLRAHDQLTEIRQADLRFSLSETDAFLNQLMKLDLPETSVAALEKRTEGWAAGLQMAALSLQGQVDAAAFIRGFTGSNRFILDYPAEEVLARRPKGTRDFLLQTAVLDRLCAPLCDAVLGNPQAIDSSSQQILEQLETDNLFLVPLDEERQWYRYHHLFATLLQQVGQREKPGLGRRAHERASRWFEQAGYSEEAVQYAIRAGDHDRAASLLEQYSEIWLWQGEIGKILMWTDRLPAGWQQQNPRLTLNYAWALLFAGRAGEVEAAVSQLSADDAASSLDLLVIRGLQAVEQGRSAQAIALLEEAEAQLRKLEQSPSNQNLRGLAVNALAYSYQIHGDPLRAEENYQVGISLNRKVGNLFAVLMAMLGWGVLLVGQGRLHEAEAVFLDGLQTEQDLARKLGIADRGLLAAAPLHIHLGQLYYEWNRLAEAESHLVVADELLAVSHPSDQGSGLTALAKLRLAQGREEAIPAILEQLEELDRKAHPASVRAHLAACLAAVRCALVPV